MASSVEEPFLPPLPQVPQQEISKPPSTILDNLALLALHIENAEKNLKAKGKPLRTITTRQISELLSHAQTMEQIPTYSATIENIIHNLHTLKQTKPTLSSQCDALIKKFENIPQAQLETPHDVLATQRLIRETALLLEKQESRKRAKEPQTESLAKRPRTEEAPQEKVPAPPYQPEEPSARPSKKRARPKEFGTEEERASKRRRGGKLFEELSLPQKLALSAPSKAKPMSARAVYKLAKRPRIEFQRTQGAEKISSSTIQKCGEVALRALPAASMGNAFETLLKSDTPPISSKLLYAIVDDAVGAKSDDLVGYDQLEGWENLASILDIIGVAGDSQFTDAIREQKELLTEGLRIQKLIQGTEDQFQQAPEQFTKALSTLSEERGLILPGGWIGRPAGHAMVYEFKRSKMQGKFQLIIHNVGAGFRFHPTMTRAEESLASSLLIDNIDFSNLTDSSFLQCLRDLKTNEKAEWSENDIYAALFPFLKGTVGEEQKITYSDTQRSGTCVFASYFAFLHSHFSPQVCGRLRIALGLKAIQGYIANFNDSTSERDIALAEKTIRNFSQMLLQAETEEWITPDDFIVIEKEMAKFSASLEKTKIDHARKDLFLREEPSQDPETLSFPIKIPFCHAPRLYAPPQQTTFSEPGDAILPPLTISNISDLNPTLLDIITWAKAQREKARDQDVHFEIGRLSSILIDVIRKNKDQLSSLDSETKASLLANFHALGEEYVRSYLVFSYRNQTTMPSSPLIVSTLLNLISCAYYVGKDEELIKKFPMDFTSIGDSFLNDFYLRFESFRDEQAFFTTVRDAPPPSEKMFGEGNDLLTPFPTFKNINEFTSPFVQYISNTYGEKIRKVVHVPHGSNAYITGLVFSEKKLRSFLPAEFFHFLDLITLMHAAYFTGGTPIVAEVNEDVPMAHWENRGKPVDTGMRVSLKQMVNTGTGNEDRLPSYPTPFFEPSDLSEPDLLKRERHEEMKQTNPVRFQRHCTSMPDLYTKKGYVDVPRKTTYQIATARTQPSLPEKELELIPSVEAFQIDTALATFSSHPSLLLQKEWQNFLEGALFSCGLLSETSHTQGLENTPDIIRAFLNRQLSLALAPPAQLDQALFLLRLFRKLYERSDSNRDALNKEVDEWFDKIKVHISELPQDQRSLFDFRWHYERVRFLDCQETLPPSQIDELIESILFVRRTVNRENTTLEYETGALIHSIFNKKEVQDRLQTDISSLINASMGNKDSARKWESVEGTQFKSDDPSPLVYHLLRGMIIESSGACTVQTPPTFIQSTMLQQATGGKLPPHMVQEGTGTFSFSIDGIQYRIEKQKDRMALYKNLDGEWYQFINEAEVEYKKEIYQSIEKIWLQKYLFHNQNIWTTDQEKKPIFRIESKEGKLLYEIKGQQLIAFEKDEQHQIFPAENIPSQFHEFEDKEYIIPISDDGSHVSKIVFPRLGGKGGLAFTSHLQTEKDGKEKEVFQNSENPDEILLPDQYLPELPRLKHKFVLKDKKTLKKRVLIPAHSLSTKNPKTASSLDTESDLTNQPWKKEIPIYSYRIQASRLIPQDTEGALYLAYTYLWQQQYEESARVLETVGQLPLSEDGVKILSWISAGAPHDNEPHSIALRLKAAAMLLRQNELFHIPIPKIDYDRLISKYNEAKHLCTNVFISADEAIALGQNPEKLKISISRTPPIKETPLIDLKSDFATLNLSIKGESPSPLRPKMGERAFKNTYEIFCDGPKNLARNWPKVQELLYSAFGVKNLGKYSPLEVERLEHILTLAARGKQSAQQTAAAILLAVLKHPTAFQEAAAEHSLDIAKKIYLSTAVSYPPSEPVATYRLAPQLKGVEEAGVLTSIEAQLPSISDPSQTPLIATLPPIFSETIAEGTPSPGPQYAADITSLIPDKNSPLATKECNKVLSDAQTIAQQTTSPVQLEVDLDNLKEALENLTKKAADIKDATKKARNDIKSLLAHTFREEEPQALQRALGGGQFFRKIGVQEAIYALLAPFPNGFFALNPALSLEDAIKLRNATITYLINKTAQQHIQKTLQACKDLASKKTPSQEDIVRVQELLKIKREYVYSENPIYLVFENAFGFLLRAQQKQTLADFLSGKEGALSQVIELIMAAGKTAVLMPMLAYLTSQQGTLSFAILPKNLYPSMAPQIAQTLQKSFSTQVFSWQLDPEKETSLSTLKMIDRGLKNALQEHQVILVRPEDITGLFLQSMALIKEPQTDEILKKLEVYQSIFTQMAGSSFLFDEVHAVWDVLKEHLLSMTNLEPLDPITIQVSATLYSLLHQKDFLPGNAPLPVEEKEFREVVSPILIDKFIDTLTASTDPVVREAARENKEIIQKYLRKEEPKSKIEHLPDPLPDMLAPAFTQIQTILPMTYSSVMRRHYGESAEKPSADSPYAVPYGEDGKPVQGNRFLNDLEEVNYTFQMYIQLPPDKLQPYFLSYVNELRSRARQEVLETPGIKTEETSSASLIKSICGEEIARSIFLASPEGATQTLLAYLTRPENISKKIDFIGRLIVPRLMRPTLYARSTSLFYDALCAILRGVSGTLWNRDTYPVPATSSPETVGKTLSILAQQNQEVLVLPPGDDTGLFQPNHGIIDIGGRLKDKEGMEVAKEILTKSESIKGVVFYDTHDIPQILVRAGKEPLTFDVIPYEGHRMREEELSAFWSQGFCTGSDLKIAPTTHCMVYVSKDITLSELFQGLWRLRKLGKGQNVQICISQESRHLICSRLQLDEAATHIELKHVIAYALSKLIDKQALGNNRAVEPKADLILQKGFVNLILRSAPVELPKILETCESLFFSTRPKRPFDRYGDSPEMVPSEDLIKSTIKATRESKACQYLINAGALDAGEVDAELEKLLDFRNNLPAQVPVPSFDTNAQVRILTRTQTRMKTQATMREEVIPPAFSKITDISKRLNILDRMQSKRWKLRAMWNRLRNYTGPEIIDVKDVVFDSAQKMHSALSPENTGCFHLGEIFTFTPDTAKFSDIIPENVGTTVNLHQVARPDFTPVTTSTQPFEYALYLKNLDKPILIALNQDDALDLLENFKSTESVTEGLFTLPTDACVAALINIHSGATYPLQRKNPLPAGLGEDLPTLISRVSLKVFSGDLHFTHEEQLALFARCVEMGEEGFEKMSTYIQNYIAPLHPQAEESKDCILSLLADKGKTFINETLTRLHTRSYNKPELLQKIQQMQTDIMRDATRIYEASFIAELAALEKTTSS